MTLEEQETRKQKLIRRLRLVIELYDEDEYVVDVAREALEYVQSLPPKEENDEHND